MLGGRNISMLYAFFKTKYMFMSRDRNAGRGHNVKIDNSSFEMVEEFKYMGTTLTPKNSI